MTDVVKPTDLAAPGVAKGDVPRTRPCLVCGTDFPSEGFGERICRRCKSRNIWSSVARNQMPGRGK